MELEDGEMETIVPAHLIIATGSRPRVLSGLEPDGEFILSSDEALTMEELPASLIIVGGGVIGVEWASMLNDFGVEVTVVEAANRLIPTEDEDVSREMQRLLTKRGVKVLTGSQVLAKTYGKDEEGVQIDVQKGEETETLSASKLLISVGRQYQCGKYRAGKYGYPRRAWLYLG